MTKTDILHSASGSHGYVTDPDANYETRRNCLWLLARGYVTLETRWSYLPEWDGAFLGYHYAQSKRFDVLKLTPAGRTYWTTGA